MQQNKKRKKKENYRALLKAAVTFLNDSNNSNDLDDRELVSIKNRD